MNKSLHILVIEPNASSARLIENELTGAGHTIKLVNGFHMARNALATDTTFDACIANHDATPLRAGQFIGFVQEQHTSLPVFFYGTECDPGKGPHILRLPMDINQPAPMHSFLAGVCDPKARKLCWDIAV